MEDLEFALQVLMLGFFVVMVALFGLYGILILFNRIFYRPAAAPDEELAARKKEKALEKENRVIAAILAAVYQYLETERAFAPAGTLGISIRPSGRAKKDSWKLRGRKELLESSIALETIRRKKKRENI